MSILDRLFRRGQSRAAAAGAVKPKMTDEEARAKRLALWNEVRAGPTPERAAQIVTEAQELLEHFGRQHPFHDNINDLIQAAGKLAGREQLFGGD